MESISDVVAYPTESDDWIVTVVLGGVFVLLGFLIVPIFLVYGYLVWVVRERTAGNPDPPAFGEWGRLLVDGLQAFVIGFVYMLVPILVGVVTVGGAALAMATGTEAGAAAGFGGLFVGLGITFLLVLVFGYVAVAAFVNFAREERFGAAFDVGVLSDVVLHRSYAVAWLVSVVVLVVAGGIASVLEAIPFVGAVVGAFVGFYAAVVAAVFWADGFSDALDQPDVTGRPGVEEPTF